MAHPNLDGDIPRFLANGDGVAVARVPAPDPWVCSDRAFRRALRWLLRKVRAAALWSTIRAPNRLSVGTCHHSVGDGFVPCEFGSPGPRTHDRRICRPPHCHGKSGSAHWQTGVSAHGVGREERGVEVTILLPAKPGKFRICWQSGTYRRGWGSRRTIHGYAVSAQAGIPNSQGTKPSPTE